MIYAQVRADKFAQVGELVRISGAQSVISNFSGITSITIKPDVALPSIAIEAEDVRDIFLDFVYPTAGEKTFTLSIIEGSMTYAAEGALTVLTKEQDNLFSDDNDLLSIEPDLLRYLPEGKSSFNYAHREAQKRIIAWLDEQRIWKDNGEKYGIQDIVGVDEFSRWSTYLTLGIIFESLIVSNGDLFEEKMKRYMDLMASARKRATIRLEFDSEGRTTKAVDRVVSIQVRR